jgi:tRNA A37 threonylcarbamoyladenosine synthetase subunit TsaC/SUA5/YrdC
MQQRDEHKKNLIQLPSSKGSTVIKLDQDEFTVLREGDFSIKALKTILTGLGYTQSE